MTEGVWQVAGGGMGKFSTKQGEECAQREGKRECGEKRRVRQAGRIKSGR